MSSDIGKSDSEHGPESDGENYMSARIQDELSDPLDRQVYAEVQRKFGDAQIVYFSRHVRWRPSWDVVIRREGDNARVIVRAEKGKNYVSPVTLRQEAGIHEVLERHGIPVPHVHCMLDEPLAIVMDVIPGQINLDTADSDAARDSIRAQYIEVLADMHRIPLSEFAELGLPVPKNASEIALNLYAACERIYRQRMNGRPFPLMDFIWSWVRRNAPQYRARMGFVSADAGQFLFEGDRLTGLIDFEVGYIGDPLAEFAGMRLRDSTEPLGDIGSMMDHYEALTGDVLDNFSIEYHTAGFCGVNGFLLWPLAFDPDTRDDFIAYLSFSVGTSRWAITAIAAALGIELGNAEAPQPAALGYPAAATHLIGAIGELQGRGPLADYELDKALSLARYQERSNTYGRAINAANLADISRLLHRVFVSVEEAEEALVVFIADAKGEHDSALANYFHRWLGRQDFLLRDCGSSSFLTGLDLQKIAPRHMRS